MSQEMHERRKKELEAFAKAQEIVEKVKKQEEDAVKTDSCPSCDTMVSDFPYVEMKGIQLLGWLECPLCGVVFCPQSILKLKKAKVEAKRMADEEKSKIVELPQNVRGEGPNSTE